MDMDDEFFEIYDDFDFIDDAFLEDMSGLIDKATQLGMILVYEY